MPAHPQAEDVATAAAGGSIRRGVVTGAPRIVLTIEGGVVLLAASAAYARLGGGWLMFVLVFVLPDASMLGYVAGRRIGAITYNAVHSYVPPVALGALGVVCAHPTLWLLALIWIAHNGLDRMIGAGLKYATAFGDTHLSKEHRRQAAG